MREKLTILGIFALIAAVMMAGPVAAVNFSADAPNPVIKTTVDKDKHSLQDMSPTEYENDQGEIEDLNAEVDSDSDNPFVFGASHVVLDEFGEFPNDKDDVSALDASEWSSTAAVEVTDVETASDVEAVKIDADGLVSGDTESATFSNFSATSDEDKRYLTLAGDVNQLTDGAMVEIQIVDADGDLKVAYIDPAQDAGNVNVAANQAGPGMLYQVQLGNLETVTGGEFNDIEEVSVVVSDADAEIDISALTIENKKPYVFGQEAYENADGETEYRDVTERNAGEPVQTTSLDEMGAQFDSAEIRNLRVDMVFGAEHVESSDVNSEFASADNYPAYDQKGTFEYRLTLPEAYDLSYTNVVLEHETNWPGDRYSSVQYIENADGDADWSDYDYDENGVDVTSDYDSEGQTITLDSTVQPGHVFAIQYDLLLTDDEADALQNDGAAGGPMGDEGGLGSLPVIGAIAGAVAALIARVRGVF